MNIATNAKLLAIVSVEHEDRVQCRQPGCGHSIYRAIHVVRDNGNLIVLGSTCFTKRYGSAETLGAARFSASACGRTLTAEERVLLVDNTAELLARFEAEELAQAKALADAKPVHVTPQAHQPLRPTVDMPPLPRTNWAALPVYSAIRGLRQQQIGRVRRQELPFPAGLPTQPVRIPRLRQYHNQPLFISGLVELPH
jgi:hypothetical protein